MYHGSAIFGWMGLDSYLGGFMVREHLTGKRMFSFGHCPNWGAEVIWAMPERKHSFSRELFP